MERRRPPESDEGFEWTDSPARPSRPRQPSSGQGEAPDGEGDHVGGGEGERTGTAERSAVSRETGSFQAIREGIAERRREREETGEFERSGQRPPSGRRSRHRDLPARIRRREAAVVGVIALVVIVGLIVLISGGGGGGSDQTVGLKRLVGQSIVARLGAKGPDQALLQRVKQGRVGGVIAFNDDAMVRPCAPARRGPSR